jgi:hypothetical protein
METKYTSFRTPLPILLIRNCVAVNFFTNFPLSNTFMFYTVELLKRKFDLKMQTVVIYEHHFFLSTYTHKNVLT